MRYTGAPPNEVSVVKSASSRDRVQPDRQTGLMAMASSTRRTKQPKVLDGLHLGLPNYWYPILSSAELGARPVGVRRFGQDLAVWRDVSGKPHVLDNHCPHRGAPLSQGVVQREQLACAYHGWTFDGSGQCTAMPLEPEDSRRADRIRIASWPAAERGGYVWMFYGSHGEASPLTIPDEIGDGDWLSYTADYQWRTNWLNILDNIMDPLHAIYLHSGARRKGSGRSSRNSRSPPTMRAGSGWAKSATAKTDRSARSKARSSSSFPT